ncbi:MAG TPA: prephenate dehydratase [Enterococcus columbae]|nr:prephenate dehydratase [Enterococcus columbae]
MKLAYLGPENSFSYQAANLVKTTEQLIAFPSIPLCIDALMNHFVDYAIVPIENSLEGSVHASIDRLYDQNDCQVQAELILPIHQQLIGYDVNNIEKILSHPQALAQCQKFLSLHYPNVQLEAVQSTTTAIEMVAKQKEAKIAAIGSRQAAIAYQLPIIAENIQDNVYNQTRFWILGRHSFVPKQLTLLEKKLTLYITLPSNLPGALHKVLSVFAWRDLNLSKIESRPQKTKLGEYFFIVDVEYTQNAKLYEYAIEELQALGCQVQVIGIYPIYQLN